MPDIFVSHATSDDKTVSRIHDALEKAGIPAWVDHEDHLGAGSNWSAEIHDALNDCLAGLFVLSPTSAKSPECEAEYRRVLSLGKRLYVALIQPVSKADFPWRLTTIQYVDLYSDFDAGMAELVRAVQGGRDLDPASPATAQANPVSGSFPRWHLDVPLIGREDELAEAQKALAGNTRATVILGLGGIGKTRLAAEIVAKTPFNHGAVWQTIAPHTSLSDLTLLIRDHLGLPPTSEADAIWRALGQRAVLIVLDNAEDCAMPAAYAERINALDLNGGTRVLMTSREQWADVHGMTRATLKAPSAEAAANIVKAMAAYEKPDMWETGHEAEIAEAARFHPRLMWYAVQWSNDAPPDEVLYMLRTLEGSDAEKALDDLVRKTVKRMQEQPDGDKAYTALRKLAVCRGGCTREAAQAIAGEVDSLKLLKRYGLVSLEGQRYLIDPLVIAAVGEDETAHRQHFDYYKALAWQHDKQQDYLGLDPESANLETAFKWAIATGGGEDALWLANACALFMGNRGRFEQRLGWMKRTVEILVDHSDDMLRANAQNTLAVFYQEMPTGNRGDNLKCAIAAYEAALVYHTSQAAPLDYAMTQNNLGIAYQILAEIEARETNLRRAIAAYEAALVYQTAQAAPLAYAATRNNLGSAYADLAAIEEREVNLKRAIAAFEAALIYWTPQAAPLDYAMTQNNLGTAYGDLAAIENHETDLKRAIAAYEAALIYRTAQAAPLDYAQTQRNLGITYQDLGNLPATITCWREAENDYRRMGVVGEADKVLHAIANAEAKLRGGG